MALGPAARIGIALVAVSAVVAVNQTSRRSPAPSVLGEKITRCEVEAPGGTVPTAPGVRQVSADQLSVTVDGGRQGATLLAPEKLTPGAEPAPSPVSVHLTVREAGKGRLSAAATVRNLSSCPVAVIAGRISARRAGSGTVAIPVRFGGRDRTIVPPDGKASARTVLDAGVDGRWLVDATVSIEVGTTR